MRHDVSGAITWPVRIGAIVGQCFLLGALARQLGPWTAYGVLSAEVLLYVAWCWAGRR